MNIENTENATDSYEQPNSNLPNQPSADDRRFAAILHLVVFANCLLPLVFSGIIILVIIKAAKTNFSNYLSIQWREAMNFNISIFIYFIVACILCIILIGIPLLFLLMLYCIVMPIIAAIKTSDGQDYRYPMIIRII